MNYSNCVIYKIVCNDENVTDSYVGHTTNFWNRKGWHEANSTHKNQKLYQVIRSNGGWSNWTMLVVERYPCNNLNEAKEREKYWINELKSTLQTSIPLRSKREYYLENREKHNETMRRYREKHRDEAYICSCGSVVQTRNKYRHDKTKKHLESLNHSSV